MSKKSVLIINQFACLPYNLFGSGERIFHLSPFLNEKYDIELISGSYNHLFKYPPKMEGNLKIENTKFLKVIWIKLRKYNKESFIGRVFSWIEFVFKLFWFKPHREPDIVIVSSMSLMPVIYAIWLKYRFKAKFILEIRDIWPLTPIELGGYSKYNPLIFMLRKIEMLGYRYADHIVSVLPGFKRYLNENKFNTKPFTWIPNGIPQYETEILESEFLKFNPNKLNVVYAGTIGIANALDTFVESARILKDNSEIHFNIIGEGPLESVLKSAAEGCENITFYPMVLKKELQSILKTADIAYIGWHNKKIYEYGVAANKYNDYMQAELPIISSSCITDDPVVLGNCGIQVNPNDATGIVEAIKELCSSEEKRRYFGINGKNYLLTHHIYPELAKKYMMVLNTVEELNERI